MLEYFRNFRKLNLSKISRYTVTREVKLLIEAQMLKDDETTAYQIHKLLTDKGINISVSTILRCRKELGWTFRGSAYCQLIRAVNKEKRLAWAKQYLDEAEDGFDNVIWVVYIFRTGPNGPDRGLKV